MLGTALRQQRPTSDSESNNCECSNRALQQQSVQQEGDFREMSVQYNWADLCSAVTVTDGIVKMRFSVVEPLNPPAKSGDASPSPGAAVRASQVLAMPLPGFVQLISVIDNIRQDPKFKSTLEQIRSQVDKRPSGQAASPNGEAGDTTGLSPETSADSLA